MFFRELLDRWIAGVGRCARREWWVAAGTALIRRERWIGLACGLVSITILWAAWEAFGRSNSPTARVIPPPSRFLADIAESDFRVGLGSQSASIEQAVFASLYRVFAGLALGTALALCVGFAISLSVWARRFVMPVVHLLAPIAPVAWIPLALVAFGIGNQTAIFVVFMGVFFTLTINVLHAIDSVPRELLELAATQGATPTQTWIAVILPAIFPATVTALRLNFIAAWMAVLAAEMTGLRDGLGTVVNLGRNLFNNNLVVFGICLIGITGYAGDLILKLIQRQFAWWGPRS